MMKEKSSKLVFIVTLAAVVSALTTVAVLFARMLMKKKALCAYNDTIDYDFDDFDDGEDDECGCCACEAEKPVQIPLAKPEDEEAQKED